MRRYAVIALAVAHALVSAPPRALSGRAAHRARRASPLDGDDAPSESGGLPADAMAQLAARVASLREREAKQVASGWAKGDVTSIALFELPHGGKIPIEGEYGDGALDDDDDEDDDDDDEDDDDDDDEDDDDGGVGGGGRAASSSAAVTCRDAICTSFRASATA